MGRTVGIAVVVFGMAVLPGCQVSSSSADAPAGRDAGQPAGSPSSAPQRLTDEEHARYAEEGYPVGDEQGVRGTVTQAEFDAQSERVERHLLEDGTGVDGVPPRYREVGGEVQEAYQTLEAIEVRQGDDIVGYWTSYFVPVEDFSAELRRAEDVIARHADGG